MRGFENRELASLAGQKSKRTEMSEKIRDMIKSKIVDEKVIEKIFSELKALKGVNYVRSSTELIKLVIPQLKSIEIKDENGNVKLPTIQFVTTENSNDKDKDK